MKLSGILLVLVASCTHDPSRMWVAKTTPAATWIGFKDIDETKPGEFYDRAKELADGACFQTDYTGITVKGGQGYAVFRCFPDPLEEARASTIRCRKNPRDIEACYQHISALYTSQSVRNKSLVPAADVRKEYQRLCRSGHQHSCGSVAAFDKQEEKYAAIFERNCEKNFYARSCLSAAGIHERKRDLSRARDYYNRACNYGVKTLRSWDHFRACDRLKTLPD